MMNESSSMNRGETVSMKAYFTKADGETEVRRFTVDQDVSTNLAYLQEKLKRLFTELNGHEVIVYWKDREGDEVRIGTDEELLEALVETSQLIKQDIFKLYVKGKKLDKPNLGAPNNGNAYEKSEGEVHPNVICDGCDNPVTGFRYKCMQCDDYDLCALCEERGVHPGHNMMRIVSPVQWGPPWRRFMRRCARWHPVFANGEWRMGTQQGGDCRRGRKNNAGKRQCPFQANVNSCDVGGDSSPESGDEKKARKEKCGDHGCFFPPPPQFIPPHPPFSHPPQPPMPGLDFGKFGEMFHGFWQGMAGMQPEQHQQQQQQQQQQGGGDQQTGQQSEGAGNNGEDFLRNVGEAVTSMLNPMGIDVLVDVEHNGQRTRCGKGKKCGKKGKKGKKCCQENMDIPLDGEEEIIIPVHHEKTTEEVGKHADEEAKASTEATQEDTISKEANPETTAAENKTGDHIEVIAGVSDDSNDEWTMVNENNTNTALTEIQQQVKALTLQQEESCRPKQMYPDLTSEIAASAPVVPTAPLAAAEETQMKEKEKPVEQIQQLLLLLLLLTHQ